MKKLFLLALLILFAATGQVSADTSVRVRIETPDKTIFDQTVAVPNGCTIKDKDGKDHALSGAKAACALDAAAKSGGFNYEFANGSFGLFLEKISTYSGTTSFFWVYRVNYKMPPVGMADYSLGGNDQLLVSFGSDPLLPLKVDLDKSVLKNDQDLVATVSVWDDTKGSFQPTPDASVFLDSANYTTGSDGKVTIHHPKVGKYNVYAEKKNQIRSERVALEVTAAPSPTSTLSVAPSTTPTPKMTITTVPTSASQVASAKSDLPTTGPGETFFFSLLSLLMGLYLRGKRLVTL